jgi:opine dehydrogenase
LENEKNMNIAILGAGSIGFAYAALLSARKHHVSLWSPSGDGIDGLLRNGGHLQAEGKLTGIFPVRPCLDLSRAVASAQVVILALPGNAHHAVMRQAADVLRDDQIVLITPVVSLSANVLNGFTVSTSRRPIICASSTTLLTARRLTGASVNVLSIRPSIDLSTMPASQSDRAIRVLSSIFDSQFDVQHSMLASSLANTGPVVHVPLALMNMGKLDRGENWLQYEHYTEHIANVITAADKERLDIGFAFGFNFASITDHMCRSFGANAGTLPNVAAQIANLRSGGPAGPKTAHTRYLTEDVPYGLGFLSFVAKVVGVATPTIDSLIALANACFGRDMVIENMLLEEIRPGISSKEDLLRVADLRDR